MVGGLALPPAGRRRLAPLLLAPIVLLAGGGALRSTASARPGEQGCARIEVSHAQRTVSAGRVSLSWEIATTADVAHFVVEQELGGGRWRSYPPLPATARSDTFAASPSRSAALRVWAVLKRGRASAPFASPAGAIAVGLVAGYWGICTPAEVRSSVEYVRLDTPATIAPWTQSGVRVIADESGPYTSSGVSGLDAGAYVARVVSFVRANPQVWAVEVLNEPGGSWFWGRDAESQANRTAYARLIVAVHDALVANFGARRPLILASYDGGESSSNAWGIGWTQNRTALADADMLTEHPYGGTEDRPRASLGHRADVEAAHAQTGKPIAITEVGFPTERATSDSMQYSDAEQAKNIADVIDWARSTGYVKAIMVYSFRDGEAGSPGYGVVTHEGRRRPAWSAVVRAAAQARG